VPYERVSPEGDGSPGRGDTLPARENDGRRTRRAHGRLTADRTGGTDDDGTAGETLAAAGEYVRHGLGYCTLALGSRARAVAGSAVGAFLAFALLYVLAGGVSNATLGEPYTGPTWGLVRDAALLSAKQLLEGAATPVWLLAEGLRPLGPVEVLVTDVTAVGRAYRYGMPRDRDTRGVWAVWRCPGDTRAGPRWTARPGGGDL